MEGYAVGLDRPIGRRGTRRESLSRSAPVLPPGARVRVRIARAALRRILPAPGDRVGRARDLSAPARVEIGVVGAVQRARLGPKYGISVGR